MKTTKKQKRKRLREFGNFLFHKEAGNQPDNSLYQVYVPMNCGYFLPYSSLFFPVPPSREECAETLNVKVMIESSKFIYKANDVGENLNISLEEFIEDARVSTTKCAHNPKRYILRRLTPNETNQVIKGFQNYAGKEKVVYRKSSIK